MRSPPMFSDTLLSVNAMTSIQDDARVDLCSGLGRREVVSHDLNPLCLTAHPLRDQRDQIGRNAEQYLLEDVYDSVSDLVGVMQTYNAKGNISRLFVSTLFKRRQEEAEAVLNRAISRSQVSSMNRWRIALHNQSRSRRGVRCWCRHHNDMFRM